MFIIRKLFDAKMHRKSNCYMPPDTFQKEYIYMKAKLDIPHCPYEQIKYWSRLPPYLLTMGQIEKYIYIYIFIFLFCHSNTEYYWLHCRSSETTLWHMLRHTISFWLNWVSQQRGSKTHHRVKGKRILIWGSSKLSLLPQTTYCILLLAT